MRLRWREGLMAALWMAVIFFMSSQPQLPDLERDWLDLVIKKAGHMLGYGILAWLYTRVPDGHPEGACRTRAVGWTLAVIYALTDEYHQTFVPGRNGSLVDVGIDGIGAGLAMLLQWWLARRHGRDRTASGARR